MAPSRNSGLCRGLFAEVSSFSMGSGMPMRAIGMATASVLEM
jgi:hypothetical protein